MCAMDDNESFEQVLKYFKNIGADKTNALDMDDNITFEQVLEYLDNTRMYNVSRVSYMDEYDNGIISRSVQLDNNRNILSAIKYENELPMSEILYEDGAPVFDTMEIPDEQRTHLEYH